MPPSPTMPSGKKDAQSLPLRGKGKKRSHSDSEIDYRSHHNSPHAEGMPRLNSVEFEIMLAAAYERGAAPTRKKMRLPLRRARVPADMDSAPDVDDEEVMFPTSHDPVTPVSSRTRQQQTGGPHSELSPPDSAQASVGGATAASSAANADMMDYTSSNPAQQATAAASSGPAAASNTATATTSATSTAGHGTNTTTGELKEGDPGYEWKNRKAQEEMSRAEATVVDRNIDPYRVIYVNGEPFLLHIPSSHERSII
ncbi:MAG: hypothetical protein M1819_000224 [Sarea resinae]|nr:MAG: hypothetical protein M1819_000224 [Sarea resinae]